MSTSVALKPDRVSPQNIRLIEPPLRRTDRIIRFERIVTAFEMVADLGTVTAAIIFAYAFYRHFALGKSIYYTPSVVAAAAFILGLIFVLRMHADGAYLPGKSLLGVRETERMLRFSLQLVLLVFAYGVLTSFLISRLVLFLASMSVPIFLLVQKEITSGLLQLLRSKGYGVRKVIIYGSGPVGRRIFSTLVRSPKLGLDPVAVIDEDPQKVGSIVYEASYSRKRSAVVKPGPLTQEFIRSLAAEEVIVAIPGLLPSKLAVIIAESAAAGAHVSFAPQHEIEHDVWITYTNLDGILLASLRSPRKRASYELFKRVFDLLFSSLILMLGLPIFLLIALLISLESHGNVIFVQDRIGKNGQLFRMYKFRTMYLNAKIYDYSPKERSDPRITRMGRFLRKTSLDELPQLLNVLKGDMALVGPRPEMPFIVEQYTPLQRRRLEVKPGLTGLWQLSADRAYLIHENIEYDLYYIRNRNCFMDFAVLLHTALFAMKGV